MNDPIERQAAIDAIEFGITYAKAINKETGEVKELFQASNDELRKAADRIKQLPSAQPEIIHCENCKNWQTGWWNRDWGLGYHWCSCVDGIRRSDWFCADAERREDDQQ